VRLRPIDLLLVVAAAILFFTGFLTGYALPANVKVRLDRGEVLAQNVRIKPWTDIIKAQIGELHIDYVITPSAHRYLRGETKSPDVVCERLPKIGTICYLYKSPTVMIRP
jgi:hypothetical protein